MKREQRKQKRKKRKPFRHLNQSDRDRIEPLLKSNHKQRDIAEILGVDPGTISKEIKKRKRKNGIYSATTAQHKAGIRRTYSKYQGMKIEKYPELRRHIISELEKHRSPDEISGRLKKLGITPRIGSNAIYKWLYSCWGQAYCKYLCTKRYRRRKQKKKTKREMIPNRVSIHKRPKKGEHGEGDIFVSPTKSGSKRNGAVICLPKSQLLVGTMTKNKRPIVMEQAVKKITSWIFIDDLTLDNGIENRYHEQFGIDTYFADPHSPWQKPHVENNIGLLRKWFIPKGTDLRKVSEKQFQKYLHILNSKYRKSLGYRSAYEVALENGTIKKAPTFRRINTLNYAKKVAFH